MKQTEENGGLRRISNEQVEQIINNQPANASYGCGCVHVLHGHGT